MSIAPITTAQIQRILVLDQNPETRNQLCALLHGYYRKTELIFQATTPDEALTIIETNAPSLLFIDIDSLGEDGRHITERINRETTDVVFTLEEKCPAIQALEFSNTRYLTKPFRIESLVSVMQQLTSKQQLKNDQTPQLSHHLEKLTLRSNEGITCLDYDNIRRLESDSNYTHFYLITGEKITIPKTLKEYEGILPSSLFFRTHQSHIVNLKMVKKFLKEDGGYALMDDGTHVLVSRRKKSDFLCALTA